MPRRLVPEVASAVVPLEALLPPPPPSPIIQLLQKDWRWAAISQFCWTFSDAFGLVDWDIETLEADFDGDETRVIPDLLAKLLFALTYNRQIKSDNAFEHIRRQYAKREIPCPLGTVETPTEWPTLGLGQKVQILHDLCEWQLADPVKFRGLLKSEDEAVSWRIDPIGWDKAGNTYFLFDDNRLWVQHPLPAPPPAPRPPKKSSLKAKKALKRQRPDPDIDTATPPTRKSHKKKEPTASSSRLRESSPFSDSLSPPPPAAIDEPVSGPRKRTQVSFYGNPTPTVLALKRGGRISDAGAGAGGGTSGSGSRSTRAHPGSLVPQAPETPTRPKGKGRASLNNGLPTATATQGMNGDSPRSTRMSRRRGGEDEWQAIPAEWLEEGGKHPAPAKTNGRAAKRQGKGRTAKTREQGSDDESDLSELTDEEEHMALLQASGVKVESRDEESTSHVLHAPIVENGEVAIPPNESEQPEEDVEMFEPDSELVTAEDQVASPSTALTPSPEIKDKSAPPISPKLNGVDETSVPISIDDQPTMDAAPIVPVTEEKQEATVTDGEEKAELPEAEAADELKEEVNEAAPPSDQANGESKADPVEAADASMVLADSGPEAKSIKEEEEEAIVAPAEEEDDEDETDEVKLAVKEANNLPAGFIEWETVCVTLYDWRTWPEQFAKSRHPDERALYQLLSEQIAPTIVAALVVKEQERIKQIAIMNRKRSSRIATRELEREEQLRREVAQAEMEERMERSRDEEHRKEREAREAAAREKAREERLKEREERAAAREEVIALRVHREAEEKAKLEKEREERYRRRMEGLGPHDARPSREGTGESVNVATPNPAGQSGSVAGSGTTSRDEKWELNCEVCRKVGWNIDGDAELVACEDCGRWQHMKCHDDKDAREGRNRRNWDTVDFRCRECRTRLARQHPRVPPTHPHAPAPANGSAPRPPPATTTYSRPPVAGDHYNPRPMIPPGYEAYYPPQHQSPLGRQSQPQPRPQSQGNGHAQPPPARGQPHSLGLGNGSAHSPHAQGHYRPQGNGSGHYHDGSRTPGNGYAYDAPPAHAHAPANGSPQQPRNVNSPYPPTGKSPLHSVPYPPGHPFAPGPPAHQAYGQRPPHQHPQHQGYNSASTPAPVPSQSQRYPPYAGPGQGQAPPSPVYPPNGHGHGHGHGHGYGYGDRGPGQQSTSIYTSRPLAHPPPPQPPQQMQYPHPHPSPQAYPHPPGPPSRSPNIPQVQQQQQPRAQVQGQVPADALPRIAQPAQPQAQPQPQPSQSEMPSIPTASPAPAPAPAPNVPVPVPGTSASSANPN